eukprot:7142341-Pyramimonas_sp.AAC.1
MAFWAIHLQEGRWGTPRGLQEVPQGCITIAASYIRHVELLGGILGPSWRAPEAALGPSWAPPRALGRARESTQRAPRGHPSGCIIRA